MNIAERVADIRRRIEAAAGGREVRLLAATKMNDAARVREAVAAGVDACGENRVQELLEKSAQGAYEGLPLHFIGHLQRNKVNKVVGLADLIESVDSEELIRLIDARAAALGIRQDILIEVNIGGEAAKSGIEPSDLASVLAFCGNFSHIRVRGLMTVPPISAEIGGNTAYFRRMNELFVDIGGKKYDNVSMDFLSMGMSGDFEEAVKAGANLVRIGSAIFGPRNYGAASPNNAPMME